MEQIKKAVFLSDIEGHINYFRRWVQGTDFIRFDRQGKLMFTQDHMVFVFGGDAMDKHAGDLEFLNLLIDFKERYPDRVFLLAGNRDIGKVRLSYELDPKFIKERLWVFNLTANPFKIPRTYLKELIAKEIGVLPVHADDDESVYQNYVGQLSVKTCQIIYLKWMLAETMACGVTDKNIGTFELRRQELARLSYRKPDAITDEEVLGSFIDSVSENGMIKRYLALTQISTVIQDTLFLHGGLTELNLYQLPQGKHPNDDPREWLSALNEWYRSAISDWMQHPLDEHRHRDLIHYASKKNKLSVVSASWLDENWAPKKISDSVKQFILKLGVKRIVSGHQPFGDFPLIMRPAPIEIISCDTCYSDESTSDCRGCAIHHLVIEFEKEKSRAKMSGKRRDNSDFEILLPSPGSYEIDGQFFYIGLEAEKGWIIGLQISPLHYLIRTRKGNETLEKVIHLQEITRLQHMT